MSYIPLHLSTPSADMNPLDTMDWADGLAFTSHDVRVGIRVTEASIWPRLIDRLPPDAAPIPPTVDHIFSIVSNVLFHGFEPILHSVDLDQLVDVTESSVRLHVATASQTRLFVHAGVVGWRGRAIVIPAPSRAGKSELVMALARAGADYYSDEYAVLDEDGLVHPYARPVALRNADGWTKRRVVIGEMGCAVGSVALPLGAVVVTRYERDASWRPRPLSAAEAVLALIANTVRARLDPPVALQRLSRAVRHITAFESARGEAADSAADILACCRFPTTADSLTLRRHDEPVGAPG